MIKKTRLFLAWALIFSQTSLFASAFSLYTESNGEAVGNFAAGIAAEVSDASIGWFNPAGLSLLHHPQALVGVVGVLPYNRISGTTLYNTDNPLDSIAPFTYTQTFTNLEGAESAAVPSIHLAYPIGPNTTLGLSVVSPFGLSTSWDPTSAVRYEATYTKLLTVDVSPEMGASFLPCLKGGLGFDFQYAEVTFNRIIGSPAIMSTIDLPANTLDSTSYNYGHSFGIGFHAGLLALFHENHTRFGANYQSPISHRFSGISRLTGRLADSTLNAYDPLVSNPNAVSTSMTLFSNPIDLPGITTLSLYQDLNQKLALLASVVVTNWSGFENVTLHDVRAAAADPLTGNISQINVVAVTEEHYRNTWRFALGANYYLLDNLMLRIGGGYEQTPTDPAERDIRLPDANRWAASCGAHYQLRKNIGIDLGYTHLFLENISINKTDPIRTSSFNVTASGIGHADLFGGQVTWTMD